MRKLKVLLLALVAVCCVMPASAQLKFGVEAGLNASKASVDNFSAKNRAGWFVGPKVQYTLPVLGLGVDASLLYSQKYLELSSDDETSSEVTTKNMPYIEIPINLKYNIGFSSLLGAYIATGPQYSWYLGGKSLSFDNLRYDGSLKTSSFSWNVGLGINAFSHLQVGVTYNIALGQTGEVQNLIDATKTAKLKNNTWQVRVAYLF